MTGSMLLLVIASLMMLSATRLRPSPWLGYRSGLGSAPIYAPVNHPKHQVRVDAPLNVNHWKANTTPKQITQQMFPPTIIHSIDPSLLLDNWGKPWDAAFGKSLKALEGETMIREKMVRCYEKWASTTRLLANPKAPAVQREVSTEHRQHLKAVLAWRNKLEMVGLVLGGLQTLFLESGSSAAHASVLALGMFRRDKLEDDTDSSIRKVFKEHEQQATRPWLSLLEKPLDVFMIEGISVAPGIPEISSTILLSNLEKYASKEQRIIVVAKRAYVGSDGSDLTEQYVRLGFTKVQMENGHQLPELVYTGTSSSATQEAVEKNPVMIGINLWTGLSDLVMDHLTAETSNAQQ